jgi:hypothetical protein
MGSRPSPFTERNTPLDAKAVPTTLKTNRVAPIVAGLWGLATRNYWKQLNKPQEARWTEELCPRDFVFNQFGRTNKR